MQMARLSSRIAVAIALFIVSGSAPCAESQDRNRPRMWEHPWTVATIAPDGSWGVATETYIYQAIAGAVSDCKRMSRQETGCGAQLKAIRAGWIIAMRCGIANIMAAEENIEAAQDAAADHERALRLVYAEEMLPCVRVITVNPHGSIIRHGPDVHRPGQTISGASSE